MPSGRVLNSGGPPNVSCPQLAARSAIEVALYFVGGLLGDDDRVLVLSARLLQHREGGGQRLLQRGVDGVGLGLRGRLVEVLQQHAGVLGDEVDRAVLQAREVRLAAADGQLLGDVDALGLQGLGVDLGEDLVLGEVGRADDDRRRRPSASAGSGAALQRIAATPAGGEGEARGGRYGQGTGDQGASHGRFLQLGCAGLRPHGRRPDGWLGHCAQPTRATARERPAGRARR